MSSIGIIRTGYTLHIYSRMLRFRALLVTCLVLVGCLFIIGWNEHLGVSYMSRMLISALCLCTIDHVFLILVGGAQTSVSDCIERNSWITNGLLFAERSRSPVATCLLAELPHFLSHAGEFGRALLL